MVQKTYPNGESLYLVRRDKFPQVFVKSGEFRAPRKGEWYLSGAEPAAYLAPADLSTPYHIMRPATGYCPHCKHRPY